MNAISSTREHLVAKAREPDRPRVLPEPSDIVEIAHIARRWVAALTILYTYPGKRRELRIFRGGWWDGPAVGI